MNSRHVNNTLTCSSMVPAAQLRSYVLEALQVLCKHDVEGGSLYSGLAGLAHCHMRVAAVCQRGMLLPAPCSSKPPDAVGTAAQAAGAAAGPAAAAEAERSVAARHHYTLALQLLQEAQRTTGRKHQRVGYLTGLAGTLATLSECFAARGRNKEAEAAAQELLQLNPLFTALDASECEVMNGRAGYITALMSVRPSLLSGGLGDTVDDVIKGVVQDVLTEGRRAAAKGIAGILCSLCDAYELLTAAQRAQLQEAASGLLRLLFPSGNLPSSAGNDKDRLVQWCHGAPGLLLLLQQLQEKGALPLPGVSPMQLHHVVTQAAQGVWERGLLTKGVGLCHGVAGNGYALLAAWQLTGDALQQLRAAAFAQFAGQHWRELYDVPDRPSSLFEGLAGCICFWLDLLDCQRAAFPCAMLRKC